jgi:hypothetical protein
MEDGRFAPEGSRLIAPSEECIPKAEKKWDREDGILLLCITPLLPAMPPFGPIKSENDSIFIATSMGRGVGHPPSNPPCSKNYLCLIISGLRIIGKMFRYFGF